MQLLPYLAIVNIQIVLAIDVKQKNLLHVHQNILMYIVCGFEYRSGKETSTNSIFHIFFSKV